MICRRSQNQAINNDNSSATAIEIRRAHPRPDYFFSGRVMINVA